MITKLFKDVIKKMAPKIPMFQDYIYDLNRYAKYSIININSLTDRQLKFRLLQRSHSFEKAFSLSDVRKGFGLEKMKELSFLIREYGKRSLPKDYPEYQMALAAVKSYLSHHQGNELEATFDFIKTLNLESFSGGSSTIEMTKESIIEKTQGSFSCLATHRYSTRQFSGEPVDKQKIVEAVKIAQKTPSVCNRQSGHAFLIDSKDLREKVIRLQAGSNGFGHEIDNLLIVTASLECFEKGKERNQAFVDGGLFAMSLIYSLTSIGIANCPLNWSASNKKDQMLRKLVDIPDEHVVIMFIAVGNYKSNVKVARSPRRDINHVYKIL
ncbi:nitroreductase family protein [Litoribacter alkaliphilus]|uniref:Nitroreductase family protein n=1 Tax=Litoribacter ruber TaxID=702568 RepID=A0AAP2CQ54_9BACT|nr:nitroreductase family protein [Litoribacter alkaliphilus]MBS9525882.1 nitroreductase family protein [Litoribacter alkaliphilus]